MKTKNTLLKLYTIEDDNGKKKDSLKEEKFAVQAINGLLNYFSETQKVKLEHINKIKLYEVKNIWL